MVLGINCLLTMLINIKLLKLLITSVMTKVTPNILIGFRFPSHILGCFENKKSLYKGRNACWGKICLTQYETLKLTPMGLKLKSALKLGQRKRCKNNDKFNSR